MYAVIENGGKQYRVSEGQTVKLELLPAEPGEMVQLDKVMLVANDNGIHVGQPFLANAKVSASVIEHGRHKKIKILKFKRRKHHMKRMGHRQYFTALKIEEIALQ